MRVIMGKSKTKRGASPSWEGACKSCSLRPSRAGVGKGAVSDWAQILPPPGFHVVPRSWVVGRAVAWLGPRRRLRKDAGQRWESREARASATMSRLLVQRLADM